MRRRSLMQRQDLKQGFFSWMFLAGHFRREAEGVRGVKREGWDQRDKETRRFRDEEQLGREERTRRQGDAEIRSDCEGSKLAGRKVSPILPRFERRE